MAPYGLSTHLTWCWQNYHLFKFLDAFGSSPWLLVFWNWRPASRCGGASSRDSGEGGIFSSLRKQGPMTAPRMHHTHSAPPVFRRSFYSNPISHLFLHPLNYKLVCFSVFFRFASLKVNYPWHLGSGFLAFWQEALPLLAVLGIPSAWHLLLRFMIPF